MPVHLTSKTGGVRLTTFSIAKSRKPINNLSTGPSLLFFGRKIKVALVGIPALLGMPIFLWSRYAPVFEVEPHAATSSFPSLHATFLFSLALPLLAMHGSRSIGLMVFVSGITVAWARIFVGVHYPFDMAGAVVTAAMATAVACAV